MKRIFPRGTTPDDIIRGVATMVTQIDVKRSWVISVEPWRKPRTNQQNRYLWGVVYPMILEAGGEMLGGFTRDDLHDYFLGSCFGFETLEGFGMKRLRPLKRSHSLTKQEFTDYLMHIENKCIEIGIGPLPEPIYTGDI